MHEIYNNMTVILIYLSYKIRYYNAQKVSKTNWPIGHNADGVDKNKEKHQAIIYHCENCCAKNARKMEKCSGENIGGILCIVFIRKKCLKKC